MTDPIRISDDQHNNAPAQCVPYTTIDLGHGKWEVGAGHNGGLPCIAFGRNGTGNVGEIITTGPRQMSVEETFAVITFANVTGLDVLQDKVDQVREEFFPGTTPQFAATPAPAPAQERCHLCDCTGDIHDATGEWRGECPYCKPAQEVGLTNHQFDLICQAIDTADTITMDGDYMLDSDDCIAVVRVMQALFDIAALRAKGGK